MPLGPKPSAMQMALDPLSGVKGRLPGCGLARIEAAYDTEQQVIRVWSSRYSESGTFRVFVDLSEMHKYSEHQHAPTDDVLDDLPLEAKYDYETQVLRFDQTSNPEFWLEINTGLVQKAWAQFVKGTGTEGGAA
mgnify:CR=1 FL=1